MHQPMQCSGYGISSNRFAVAIKMEYFRFRVLTAAFPGNPDRSDGFTGQSPARSGNTGHCHGQTGAGCYQRSRHHFQYGFPADRTELHQSFGTDSQQCLFGFVTVSRHPAIKPGRAAGNIGQYLGNPASGAAFGGAQAQVLRHEHLA